GSNYLDERSDRCPFADPFPPPRLEQECSTLPTGAWREPRRFERGGRSGCIRPASISPETVRGNGWRHQGGGPG
ncbi:MAG TPA: hypothetical protein VGS23_05150, partial [Thermoplasmata archaeon]|nr:hypothetical protein [Thermoplasmata archaeon]